MTIERDSGDSFLFPSSQGTAIGTSNSLFPRAQGGREETGIEGATHQMLGRTGSTYMAQITTVKDLQASSKTTLPQPWSTTSSPLPASARAAVESLDHLLIENARVQ
jgi:hypothetical protein